MTKHWLTSITALCGNPWVTQIALTLYYLGIIAGLIAIYGRGDFSTPPFVYQSF